MIKFFSIISVAAALAACGQSKIISVVSPENNVSELEKTQGWQSLFDGTTTNGWHGYGRAEAPAAWVVQDGALYLDTDAKKAGAKGGDLVSNNAYENFHLKYDWKISKNGNSGLIFLVNEDTARFHATYSSGPEMQVLDTDGHPDGKIIKHHAGDLYDLLSAKPNTKPVGEWNTAEIILDHGKLEFFMNGEKTLSTTMWDDNWNSMVANSKFKNWNGFGTFRSGKFALQDHGDKVWFKNIKIRPL